MKNEINQRGFVFIPLLIIAFTLAVVASVGTGVVLGKQGKLAPKSGESQIEQSEADQEIGTTKATEKAGISAEIEATENEAEQAKIDIAKVKKAEESRKIVETARQNEIIRQQQIERQQQLEEERKQDEAKLAEEQKNQEKQQLQNILTEEINSQISQANSLANQIAAKQGEINIIINDYNQKIESESDRLAPMSVIRARQAKLDQEKQLKLVIPYQELQSLTNRYNTLTGNPIYLVIPQKTTIFPQYMTFYPDSAGGGDIYGNSGSFHIKVERTTDGYELYF